VRRRLLTSCSILCLLLCAVTLISWEASRYREDTLGWAGWKDKSAGIWRGWGIKIEGGKLLAYRFSGNWKFDDPAHVGPSDAKMEPHFVHVSHRVTGYGYLPRKAFEWKTSHVSGGGSYIHILFIGLPLWLPVSIFAMPIVWAFLLRIRRRRALGQGFDVLPQPVTELG